MNADSSYTQKQRQGDIPTTEPSNEKIWLQYAMTANKPVLRLHSNPFEFVYNSQCVIELIDFLIGPISNMIVIVSNFGLNDYLGQGLRMSSNEFVSEEERNAASSSHVTKIAKTSFAADWICDGMDLFVNIDGPRIIIPQDVSIEKGYVVLDVGNMYFQGKLQDLNTEGLYNWTLELSSICVRMPLTNSDMQEFNSEKLFLIKPFNITASGNPMEKSSYIPDAVKIDIVPELKITVDPGKLGRLIDALRSVVAMGIQIQEELKHTQVAAEKFRQFGAWAWRRNRTLFALSEAAEREARDGHSHFLMKSFSMSSDVGHHSLKDRNSETLTDSQLRGDDPDMDSILSILAPGNRFISEKSRQIALDPLFKLADVVFRLDLLTIEVQFTYGSHHPDQRNNQSLVLEKLQVNSTTRPFDVSVLAQIGKISVTDSLRPASQKYLLRSSPIYSDVHGSYSTSEVVAEERSALRISYLGIQNQRSPYFCADSFGSVVDISMEKLDLSIDSSAVLHTQSLLEILIEKLSPTEEADKHSPSKSSLYPFGAKNSSSFEDDANEWKEMLDGGPSLDGLGQASSAEEFFLGQFNLGSSFRQTRSQTAGGDSLGGDVNGNGNNDPSSGPKALEKDGSRGKSLLDASSTASMQVPLRRNTVNEEDSIKNLEVVGKDKVMSNEGLYQHMGLVKPRPFVPHKVSPQLTRTHIRFDAHSVDAEVLNAGDDEELSSYELDDVYRCIMRGIRFSFFTSGTMRRSLRVTNNGEVMINFFEMIDTRKMSRDAAFRTLLCMIPANDSFGKSKNLLVPRKKKANRKSGNTSSSNPDYWWMRTDDEFDFQGGEGAASSSDIKEMMQSVETSNSLNGTKKPESHDDDHFFVLKSREEKRGINSIDIVVNNILACGSLDALIDVSNVTVNIAFSIMTVISPSYSESFLHSVNGANNSPRTINASYSPPMKNRGNYDSIYSYSYVDPSLQERENAEKALKEDEKEFLAAEYGQSARVDDDDDDDSSTDSGQSRDYESLYPVTKVYPTSTFVRMQVSNPYLIILDDPNEDSSQSVLTQCVIDVQFHLDAWGSLEETQEALHITIQAIEVFVLPNTRQWIQSNAQQKLLGFLRQRIFKPFSVDFHLTRRLEKGIVLAANMSFNMSDADIEISIVNLALAQSILSRRTLTGLSPPQVNR